MAVRAVLGAIIAGGASTRFGRAKALAEVGGSRVIDRAARAVRAVPDVDDIITIVNDPELAAHIGMRHRADSISGAGALGGVHAALIEARQGGYAGVLGVACDMPFLSPELISVLLDVREGHDVVIPESEGRRGIEPLCAYYDIRCLAAIEHAIESADVRMVGFHAGVDVYRLPLATVRSFGDPAVMFMNLNTEADRIAAEHIAAEMDAHRDSDRDARRDMGTG